MKHALEIFFRWLIVALFIFLMYSISHAQCCDFELINKADTITKNQLIAVEIPLGKMAVISFVDVYVPIAYTIENNSAQVKYVGTWTHATNTTDPFSGNTCSYSNTVGNTAEITFTGTIEMWSAKASHHGKIGVSLNGGPEIVKDMYSATRISNVMIFNSLEPGTIKIRVISGYCVIDYFKNVR